MINENNPLNPLIKLYEDKHTSLLVHDLIDLICEKIQITEEELISDTFHQQAKSKLVYKVLLDIPLLKSPLHKKMMERCSSIWEKWERDGFYVAVINKWNSLSVPHKHIACQIWDTVQKNLGKTVQFEQLIDKHKRNIDEINKTVENVTLCIRDYCQDAYDQNHYSTHLRTWQNEFAQATTCTIPMSTEIQELKQFADRLGPIPSTIWQDFLKKNLQPESMLFGSFRLTLISNNLSN